MNTLVEQHKKMVESWTAMFNMPNPIEPVNPMKLMTLAFEKAEENKKMFDNYMKYHQAFIDYHEAIKTMAEAMNDNLEIMKSMTK